MNSEARGNFSRGKRRVGRGRDGEICLVKWRREGGERRDF